MLLENIVYIYLQFLQFHYSFLFFDQKLHKVQHYLHFYYFLLLLSYLKVLGFLHHYHLNLFLFLHLQWLFLEILHFHLDFQNLQNNNQHFYHLVSILSLNLNMEIMLDLVLLTILFYQVHNLLSKFQHFLLQYK